MAGAPLALLRQFGQATHSLLFLEEFLVQCAAGITACWYLAKGHDLLIVEQLLSLYVPLLSQIGSQNPSHQQAAAGLLVQACLIRALMALHRQDLATREHHSREAVRYSHLVSESNLQAAAFLFHVYSSYYMQQPEHALGLFQRAIETFKEMSPLLRSDLSLGMAAAYAQCGKEEPAKDALTSAHLYFPSSPEYDPGFLYADCSLSTLYLWEGRTYLDLGALTANSAYYQQASDILNQIEGLAVMNSERNRTGMVLCQARAALGLGEFEQCWLHLEIGIALVEQLGSVRRFHEASTVLQQLVHRWPHEKQSRQLTERLKQSPLARQLFPSQK